MGQLGVKVEFIHNADTCTNGTQGRNQDEIANNTSTAKTGQNLESYFAFQTIKHDQYRRKDVIFRLKRKPDPARSQLGSSV